MVANLRGQHSYEQYMKSLNDFEVLFDSELGRLSKADAQRVYVPEFVKVIVEDSDVGTMNGGVFWSKEIVRQEEGREIPDEELLTYTWRKKKLRGIIRDKKYGEPPGSITLTQAQAIKIQREKKVEGGAATFKKLAAKTESTLKKREPGDNGESTFVVVCKKANQSVDDSSCDWADDMLLGDTGRRSAAVE